jgi:ABC-type transporter lipoprotein component MlaA
LTINAFFVNYYTPPVLRLISVNGLSSISTASSRDSILLCEDIMIMLELDNVTRQALSGYKAIQEAYTARKQYLRENKNAEVQPVNSNIEYWQNQVESLEAELKRNIFGCNYYFWHD